MYRDDASLEDGTRCGQESEPRSGIPLHNTGDPIQIQSHLCEEQLKSLEVLR